MVKSVNPLILETFSKVRGFFYSSISVLKDSIVDRFKISVYIIYDTGQASIFKW